MSKPPSRYWPLWSVLLLAATVLIWWLGRPAPRAEHPPVAAKTEAAPVPQPPEERDPLAIALDHADPRERAIRFNTALNELSSRDSAEAAAALRRLKRGPEFTQGLYTIVDFIAARDPEAALRLAAELARSRDELACYSILFDRFARDDPRAAAARLPLVPAGDARENAARAIASAWSRADAEAALAWAESLAEAALRDAAVETALADLAQRDPRRAIEVARRSLRPPVMERVLFNAVQHLGNSDPAAAASLVALLPPGDQQTMLASHIARTLADRSVPDALAWVKAIPVDLTRWMAFNSVLTSWVQRDRKAAMRHVLELPPGQGTEFAASHLAQFIANDPADAILWAGALPDEPSRAAANAQIASSWAQRAPAEAVRWAASLNEDPFRPNALGGAFSHWMLVDAAAAMAWLEQSSVPAATKARLLRRQ